MTAKTRLIKRYQNRKLYDTTESKYVTLDEIAELIRQGEDIKVIDNQKGEDLTSVTLTQIIFELEKKKRSLLPIETLKNIIGSGGEKIASFVHSSIESGVSSISHAREEIDKKLKTAIDTVSSLPSVQSELRGLHKKIEELERKLRKYEK
ncbi:MAG: polyhydroxyalkanoate synthesis regulator DNA-binding domain-containing protein [Deltaproteobacteria bacterium]|nr:polyhydroxyalkanoate synthesis regulator DNA-binding domain-containing protein [Deltaproteobacteria bacterium]